jgi:hypothetical protein
MFLSVAHKPFHVEYERINVTEKPHFSVANGGSSC